MIIRAMVTPSNTSSSFDEFITYPIRRTGFVLVIALTAFPLPRQDVDDFLESYDQSLYDNHKGEERVEQSRLQQDDLDKAIFFQMEQNLGDLTYAQLRVGVDGLIYFFQDRHMYRSLNAELRIGATEILIGTMSFGRIHPSYNLVSQGNTNLTMVS